MLLFKVRAGLILWRVFFFSFGVFRSCSFFFFFSSINLIPLFNLFQVSWVFYPFARIPHALVFSSDFFLVRTFFHFFYCGLFKAKTAFSMIGRIEKQGLCFIL